MTTFVHTCESIPSQYRSGDEPVHLLDVEESSTECGVPCDELILVRNLSALTGNSPQCEECKEALE